MTGREEDLGPAEQNLAEKLRIAAERRRRERIVVEPLPVVVPTPAKPPPRTAPPQEEQAAPPVIYTVDPMERPGWVDPDKKPTPPTLTKEDYTYSPGNVYEKYPGLTTAQYETLKSKITTEQQKQREEAAKTPQEKYEEYKTETLVPYLTETVGLMGTIGPEMKPPEKVEDYYSWQEESLDPWSSKVRKKRVKYHRKIRNLQRRNTYPFPS